jgi:hypothetical protein
MILFNVGDSHTYPDSRWCQPVEEHYWYRIAKDIFNCTEIINHSKPGRSNDAMLKAVMQHCLENPITPTVYFINITNIFRMDINDHSNTLHDILTPSAIAQIDFETIECTLYSHLIGTIEFLKYQKKPFLIFNNGKNFSLEPLPKRDAFVNYVKNEPAFLNWFTDSKVDYHSAITKIKPVDYDLYGWNGHDGIEGHSAMYDRLINFIPDKYFKLE